MNNYYYATREGRNKCWEKDARECSLQCRRGEETRGVCEKLQRILCWGRRATKKDVCVYVCMMYVGMMNGWDVIVCE